MLLSINENKLFCKKLWIFPAFPVPAGRFLPPDSDLLGRVSVCWGSGAGVCVYIM